MTSELRPSEPISEFVSGGPKKYAYNVLDTVTGTVDKTVCKFRVITLNYNASRLVNFVVIRNTILSGTRDEPTVVNVHTEKNIRRKRTAGGEPYRLSSNRRLNLLNFILHDSTIR